MLDFLTSVFTNVWTYVIMVILGLGIGWKFVRSFLPKSTRPILNKKNLFIGGLAGVLILSGALGSISFGSIASSTGTSIVSSQITTDFVTDLGGSVSVSTTEANVINVRLTDAQANETDGFFELDSGVIQVTRSGGDADSCTVQATVPSDYSNQDGSDQSTMYHLVERSGSGSAQVTEVYLTAGASSVAATSDSSTMTTELSFAEGVSTGYVGVAIELDEEGFDAMNQYESLPVYVNICGEYYTINFYRMD